MESHHMMQRGGAACETDHGQEPVTVQVACAARQNPHFRRAFWTGDHLQMTLMSIPVCGEIGVEMHPDTEQFIRVEEGQALVCMGSCRDELDKHCRLCQGDAVFVPCGTWHNIVNNGRCPLKLSSIYAPPQHRKGTIHHTKADAEARAL